MSQRIFISSVQREFAKERKALAEYVRKDAILGRFFDVFLFEEVPAQERKADGVYLTEVDACDIYLGIFGHTYGNVDSSGVSATEREYLRAAKRHKTRICFVNKSAGDTDPRQAAFISRVSEDVVRKGFVGPHDAANSAAATSRFELPESAVREAIVNAVCHRDYASAASVQVMLFKDRLEIWSPGPLPKGMTLAKMYKRHKSYPANPLLAYAMFLRKYVEQTGTGTGDIIARCREWGLPDPQWQIEDDEDFVMVMPRPQSSVRSVVRSVDRSVDKSVDWTCDHVLSILKTNPRATLDQVANVVGLSVRGVEQAIKRLKKAKRIRKVGGKRFGHWEVIG